MMSTINMFWPERWKFPVPKHRTEVQVRSGSLGSIPWSPTSSHPVPVPAAAPAYARRTKQFFLSTLNGFSPFHLNGFFFLIHFYFILFYFFIYFPSVSFSIWKVTWPLFPPSIFLLPLFSLGMKHRTRLKAFNGHSIGEEKSPSELY